MSWSAVIETIIGLSFIFLILSLIASGIQEGISSLFRSRARYLRKGVENMLKAGANVDFAKKLLGHDLMKSLAKEYRWPMRKLRADGPSYLPPSVFRKVLVDVLSTHLRAPVDEEFVVRVRERLDPLAPATDRPPAGKGGQAVHDEPARQGKPLRDEEAAPAQGGPAPGGPSADGLTGTRLGEVLRVFTVTSENNLTLFYREIEEWFDSAMDRVGGWYKRRTQVSLFGIGLVLALALNADVISISTHLYQNPESRARVVAAADTFIERAEADTSLVSVQTAVQELRSSLDERTMPLGWQAGRAEAPWPWKVLGLFLMAVAITFGAPFWFDMLQHFVNLRGAGKEEASASSKSATTGAQASAPDRYVVYRASEPPRR